MKKIRVAINGFGRIGRVTAKYILQRDTVELVAINDLADSTTLAHLFKYDSVHGRFNGTVTAEKDALIINGKRIACFASKDALALGWKALDVDVVIESTGHLTTMEGAQQHITAGAKKVIISAPAKTDEIKAIVLGVNENILDGTETVDITSGEVARVNVDPMGRANINAAPWAEVWVDGVKIGDTPLANVAIRLGVREIVFKNPQYPERKQTITVVGGPAATISVDFNKQ